MAQGDLADMHNGMKIVLCILYLFFGMAGMTLIKMGGQDGGKGVGLLGCFISCRMLAGLACYGTSFLLYTAVISRMQISLVLPVLSALNSCLAVAVGLVLFHEKLSHGQMAGIALVVLGVFIIGSCGRG